MMRRASNLVSILAMVVVLGVACSPASTPAPAPTTAKAAAPAAAQPTAAAPASAAQSTAAPVAQPAVSGTIRWGIYADPGRQKVAEAQVAAFQKKYPDIKVTIESAPFAQYYDKMSAQIVGNTLYDVFMMSGANFQNFAPKGAFEDLTPYIEKSGIKLDEYTTEKENSLYQGKVMAVPYELDIQGLFYNKDLFDKAGVKYPDESWTWEDLRKAAQKLTVTGSDGKAEQWGFYSENLYPSYVSFIAQNGGSVLSEDLSKCALTTPEAIQAIKFMVDLIHQDRVSPMPGQLPSGVNPFHTGKVAMRIDGSYSVNPTLAVPFRWDVAALPQGKKRAAAYWTQATSVFKNSKQKDAAWTFVQFLLSDEGQRILAESKFATPSKKAIASSPAYLTGNPEHIKVFVDAYAHGRSIQFTPQWFQIMAGGTSVIARAFDPVWLGQAKVEDAVKSASAEVDKILAGR